MLRAFLKVGYVGFQRFPLEILGLSDPLGGCAQVFGCQIVPQGPKEGGHLPLLISDSHVHLFYSGDAVPHRLLYRSSIPASAVLIAPDVFEASTKIIVADRAASRRFRSL